MVRGVRGQLGCLVVVSEGRGLHGGRAFCLGTFRYCVPLYQFIDEYFGQCL